MINGFPLSSYNYLLLDQSKNLIISANRVFNYLEIYQVNMYCFHFKYDSIITFILIIPYRTGDQIESINERLLLILQNK